MLNRRNIMKQAWKMFKKGFADTFAKCLKSSWQLDKKVNKYFKNKNLTSEEATKIMLNDSSFWRHCQVQKLEGGEWGKRTYAGKGVQTYEITNIWVVDGRARVYAEMSIDNWVVKKSYVEVLSA